MYSISAFADELSSILKQAEYAPGIPSKETSHSIPSVSKPTVWEIALHDHEAKRRGRHFDLRLGDPETNRAHSWAMPPKLPGPGTSSWAIQQPTHTVRYMDFEGEIPSGYGAGRVALSLRDKTEVMKASPDHVRFNIYKSSGPQEFVLRKLGGKMWKLFNTTPTPERLNIKFGKPDYREIKPEKLNFEDSSQVMSAKIDDAHNIFVLPESGKPIRVVSYRQAKKTDTGLIEHTHKVPDLHGEIVPAGLGNTVLRGGLYAIDPKTGRALDAHILGGLLNSDVWKSREKQKQHGKLISVLYDIERFKGRDVSSAPYSEKLEMLKKIIEKIPAFHLPPMAFTPTEKVKLLTKIEAGKLPHTSEGVVLWNLHEGKPPIKAKFKGTHDVYIRRIFGGGGKYEGSHSGGFEFSHTQDGPIVGRVGTGLSDSLRADMHKHPDKYMGAVAVLESMTKYKSGALRAPAFKSWHLDKNEPGQLDKMVPR